MSMRSVRANLLTVTCAVFLVLAATGCPPGQNAKVRLLLAGDSGPLLAAKSATDGQVVQKAGELTLDEIASLKITVTEVSLDRSGPVTAEGEGEGEGERVVVFTGEKEVDIRDLTGISELLSESSITAGHYTKVRLTVKDPKLVLATDPETVITDIQLTANGRLFVSESFDLPDGQTSLVLLDFEGLHIVETGNGKYVWTPQLRARISVAPAQAVVTGTISAVDTSTATLTVNVSENGQPVEVDYGSAVIFLPTDTDTPSGTADDLVVDTTLTVEGTLSVSGPLHADTIRLGSPI